MAAALVLAVLAPEARAAGKSGALLPGSSGREPVSIDAGKLDYFQKDGKLVYSGEVVAKQGTSTLKGSVLTIFLSKEAKKAADATATPGAAPIGAGNSSIERMDIAGPVTVISQDEVGTGDHGAYDKAANTVTLTGNVTLTQSTNVIKGDRLVYDMGSGQAQVFSGQTQGRVRSIFTPGSPASGLASPTGAKRGKNGATAKPATAAAGAQ